MRPSAGLGIAVAVAVLAVPAVPAHAQAAGPLPLLDVPFISQSEALCGGAAAAMILRYWGARGITAEMFGHLVDREAGGIRTDVLTEDLQRRGWMAVGLPGTTGDLAAALARGQPVLALIEDRPSAFHYVVVVGWHPRGVVYHDPARAPFVAMSTDAFDRRWRAAGQWMAVVVPAHAPSAAVAGPPFPDPPAPAGTNPCETAVAAGISLARANDLDGAERALTGALGCPDALRELAGVRVLQKRWAEAEDLAAAAIAAGDDDRYAWQVLGTARFVRDNRLGALAAWNRVSEPRLDLVAIDGLERTRHRVVERLLRLETGAVLTPARLIRARRQLALLPSASSVRVDYVPVGSGLTEVRAAVAERPVLPRGVLPLAAAGLVAAATRELQIRSGSLTGGGDVVSAAWRFWPDRERLGVALAAPGPAGVVWGVDLFTDRQPFTGAGTARSERRGAHLAAEAWATDRVYWRVAAGVDKWSPRSALGNVAGRLRVLSPGDRVEVGGGLERWTGGRGFTLADGAMKIRSAALRPSPGSLVFLGEIGWQAASSDAPLDIWPAGDTGHARPVPLRAHPALEGGRLRIERLGRRVGYASMEAQRWWKGPGLLNLAGAAFGDTGVTSLRTAGGALTDVDLGVGARLAVTGVPGIFRIDLAKGLRDGATALSVSYTPNP